jgi:alanine racemase
MGMLLDQERTPCRSAAGGDHPVLTIDLDSVAANARLFAAHASGELMAVIKADGFGHGAVAVAETALANGATWLGVATLDEALVLRRSGLTAPVLSWLNTLGSGFEEAIAHGIDLAVPSREHLSAIGVAAAAVGRPARVHLQVDCGMARDGAPRHGWTALCASAKRAENQGLVRVVGVMGHLGCAADPADECNARGRRTFADAVRVAVLRGLRPAHRHLAATAATLHDPLSHHTICRVGAGLVGIDPSGSTSLAAALTLQASVVSVREVVSGTPVGYDHGWRAPSKTRLALVPLGYADGVPRSASNRAQMFVRGRRCPVAGLISMDQSVIDVGHLDVAPGDTVTVFGPGASGEPTVREWAGWAGTIEHEIVTGIGPRVARRPRGADETSGS